MSQYSTVFPASTVAKLKGQLDVAGPSMLRVQPQGFFAGLWWKFVGAHLELQVIPVSGSASGPKAAASLGAPATFAPLNDSHLCPGSPGCPQ